MPGASPGVTDGRRGPRGHRRGKGRANSCWREKRKEILTQATRREDRGLDGKEAPSRSYWDSVIGRKSELGGFGQPLQLWTPWAGSHSAVPGGQAAVTPAPGLPLPSGENGFGVRALARLFVCFWKDMREERRMLIGFNLMDLGRLLPFDFFLCNYLKIIKKKIKEIPHSFPLPH